MNFLILAAGTRNKLVRYFRQAFHGAGRVIAADASPLAPALYEADARYIVPEITHPGYMDAVLDICRRERISGLTSLIDPEMTLLAACAERFRAVGATLVGSSRQLCEMSMNKSAMYRFLQSRGFPCARTWTSLEDFHRAAEAGQVSYPVFVKPVFGSASRCAFRADSRALADALLESRPDMLAQEYLDGQEIGADVYADMLSGQAVSIFTREKLRMRAGETDKAVSFRDEKLFALIERLVETAGYRGPLDIDLFRVNGEYLVSEVNPRFGGGYPHAHECGCDHVGLILNNLRGVANPKRIGGYESGVYMMKYSEVRVGKDL